MSLDRIIQKFNDYSNLEFEKRPLEPELNQLIGSLYQRERLYEMAEYSCQNYKGDLIEIGGYLGETTVILAKVAKKYNRKVIVVDPWEKGTQNCDGTQYDIFINNTKDYKEYIEIYRESSLTDELRNKIKKHNLCFSFVDGLHTFPAAYFDINTVNHTNGVICLDDITQLDIFPVISFFLANNKNFKLIDTLDLTFRECYFIINNV